jgi:hypothetical protein
MALQKMLTFPLIRLRRKYWTTLVLKTIIISLDYFKKIENGIVIGKDNLK